MRSASTNGRSFEVANHDQLLVESVTLQHGTEEVAVRTSQVDSITTEMIIDGVMVPTDNSA